MDPLDINLGSISVFTLCALSAARKYVDLVEAQMSQAHDDLLHAALDEYRNIPNPDEADYDTYVRVVDRSFEEEYQPILRYTEVVYLCMVFETYTSRHIAEIQVLQKGKPDILEKSTRQKRCSLVEAARIYFRDHIKWSLLDDSDWAALREIAEVRNCIVHSTGIVRDRKYSNFIYSLEARKWCQESVGIEIDRYQGKDIGLPIIIHRRFLEYVLDLLDRFFGALVEKTHAEFWNKKGT